MDVYGSWFGWYLVIWRESMWDVGLGVGVDVVVYGVPSVWDVWLSDGVDVAMAVQRGRVDYVCGVGVLMWGISLDVVVYWC